MPGMAMAQQTWYGAAAGYLGIWMAMLSRYRRSVRGADGIQLHGLTTLVGAGYFVVWAVLGAGVMAVEMRWGKVTQWLPVAAGVVLLVAGGVRLTSWKARQLARWGEGSG